MTTTIIEQKPFSPGKTQKIIDTFNRDGCVNVGPLLSADEAAELREAIDRIFADPEAEKTDNIYSPYIAVRLFEHDIRFRDLAVREPLISLMEAMLGEDCHIIANNCVRNRPGEAIDGFHADDFVWFPLPDDIPRFDSRMTMPTFLVNTHIALTDVETEEHGPLQYVSGSHYSGRQPNDPKDPEFEGQRKVSMFAKAGELYLQHPQVWHRGAPNTSDRTRYITGFGFSKRFISQRFYPFLNYRMPDHVLEGADERLLRVLGKHPKGAYG